MAQSAETLLGAWWVEKQLHTALSRLEAIVKSKEDAHGHQHDERGRFAAHGGGKPARDSSKVSDDELSAERPSLTKKVIAKWPKDDWANHKIRLGGKVVGHISGFDRREHERGPDGVLRPVEWLDITKTELDQELRGRGIYQDALQQVADSYSDGARSLKVQTSRAFEKAMRKMPTFSEDGKYFVIAPSSAKASSAALEPTPTPDPDADIIAELDKSNAEYLARRRAEPETEGRTDKPAITVGGYRSRPKKPK